MKIILVIYTMKEEPIEEKQENQLRWYDTIKKEMQFFVGGQLEFEYRHDDYLAGQGYKNTYRLLPKSVELVLIKKKKVSNKNDILKWFNSYSNYNNTNSTINYIHDEGINFNVPDAEVNDFTYDLDRNNIDYRT